MSWLNPFRRRTKTGVVWMNPAQGAEPQTTVEEYVRTTDLAMANMRRKLELYEGGFAEITKLVERHPPAVVDEQLGEVRVITGASTKQKLWVSIHGIRQVLSRMRAVKYEKSSPDLPTSPAA